MAFNLQSKYEQNLASKLFSLKAEKGPHTNHKVTYRKLSEHILIDHSRRVHPLPPHCISASDRQSSPLNSHHHSYKKKKKNGIRQSADQRSLSLTSRLDSFYCYSEKHDKVEYPSQHTHSKKQQKHKP